MEDKIMSDDPLIEKEKEDAAEFQQEQGLPVTEITPTEVVPPKTYKSPFGGQIGSSSIDLTKEGAEDTVVVAPLVPPVIVSDATKVPEGIVIVKVVPVGLVITEAVAPLVPPVIVSEIVKLALAPTVSVTVPNGYSIISLAKVCVS